MGVIKGAISIADNMSAVLRSIKQEQSSFRKDVAKTKKELQATWDKQHKARLDATAAHKAMEGLKQKAAPLKKKIVMAAALKDAASEKIRSVTNKVKGVGRLVASPFVKLKDKATSLVKGIANKVKSVGKMVAHVAVKLKDGVTAGLSKIKSGITSVAKNVVVPVALATTVIAGGAINQGAQLEQSLGGVDTLFKDSSSVVKANAASAFKTAGLSANEYMEQVTSFSASLISSLGGDTAKAATVADMAMGDMADNANKFGTDMESIQNAYQGFAKQNYTMLDNLKLGYGGTKEEMQRLLQDAQKLTGTEYNIDNLSDVYNAIHAVQDNLGVTGTTAKEASETFSGSFSAMKAAAQNLLGNLAIGGDVTGSIKDLVDTASTFLLNNALPMVGRIISSLPQVIKSGIKSAGPKIKEAAGDIVKNLKGGLTSLLPSSMGGLVSSVFDGLLPKIGPALQKIGSGLGSMLKSASPYLLDFGESIIDGIGGAIDFAAAIMPQLVSAFDAVLPVIVNIAGGLQALMPSIMSFGGTLMEAIQQVGTAVMPVIGTIMDTVQAVIPAVLPVLETVVTQIGSIISAAAPIISGLVEGIGQVITALAPVFQTIFDGIGEKVGSVLEFVGSKMGWIQNIIGQAAPLIADILSSAWSVISPVMDLAINVFKILFNVAQSVFEGILNVVQNVWAAVKPIIDSVANAMTWVADKVGGLFGFGGGGGGGVGTNAEGTNNWRGGPTWVGEKGPELVDLPRGSRVLPNKESVRIAKNAAQPVLREVVQNTIAQPVIYSAGDGSSPALDRIGGGMGAIIDLLKQLRQGNGSWPPPGPSPQRAGGGTAPVIYLNIAKLADELVIREDADIDRIGEALAKKLVLAAQNLVPA